MNWLFSSSSSTPTNANKAQAQPKQTTSSSSTSRPPVPVATAPPATTARSAPPASSSSYAPPAYSSNHKNSALAAGLFGGLEVKSSAVPPEPSPKSIPDTSKNNNSQIIASAVQEPSISMSSGFSFIQETSQSDSPITEIISEPMQESAISAFSFISGSSSSAAVPEPPVEIEEIKQSATSNNHHQQESIDEQDIMSFDLLETQQPKSTFTASHVVIEPAKVKKVKTIKRPGFAREESSTLSAADAPSTETSSILKGLTIYNEATDTTQSINADTADVPNYSEQDIHHEISSAYPMTQEPHPVAVVENSAPSSFSFITSSSQPAINEPENIVATVAATNHVANTKATTINVAPPIKVESVSTNKTGNSQHDEISKLKSMTVAFNTSSETFSTRLKAIRKSLQENKIKRSLLREKKEMLKKSISDLETQQSISTEAEDFEKAESLQQEIDKVNLDLISIENETRRIDTERSKLEQASQGLINDKYDEVSSINGTLKAYLNSLQGKSESLLLSSTSEMAVRKQRFQESRDMIKGEIEALELDKAVITKEQDSINEKIDDQTSSLRTQHEQWNSKVKVIDEEIEQLLKLLEEKRTLREAHIKELSQIDSEINMVKSKYGTRLSELNAKMDKINDKKASIERRETALNHAEEEFEKQRKVTEEEMESVKNVINEMELDFKVSEYVLLRLADDKTNEQNSQASGKLQTEAINKMRDDVAWKQSAIEVFGREIAQVTTTAYELGNKTTEAQNRLPGLEQQKKIAVTSRNFKEASKVTTEIKELQSKIESDQLELKEIEQKRDELEQNRISKQEELVSLQKELRELEDKEEISYLLSLREKVKTIRSQMREIKKIGDSTKVSSLREAAKGMLQVECDAILSEIDATANRIGKPELGTSTLVEEPVETETQEGTTEVTDEVKENDAQNDVEKEAEQVIETVEDVVDAPSSNDNVESDKVEEELPSSQESEDVVAKEESDDVQKDDQEDQDITEVNKEDDDSPPTGEGTNEAAEATNQVDEVVNGEEVTTTSSDNQISIDEAKANMADIRQKIAEKEAMLEEYIAAESYEDAEALNTEIGELQTDMMKLISQFGEEAFAE